MKSDRITSLELVKLVSLFLVVTSLAVALELDLFGQTPKTVPVPADIQNRILKAEHEHDALKAQESDILQQVFQYQLKIKELQITYSGLDGQEKAAAAKVTEAEAEAWKAAELDQAKYSVDWDAMTFTEKAPKGNGESK